MKTLYWDRTPGKFVNKETGVELAEQPEWKGRVLDWYNSLYDVIVEAADNQPADITTSEDVGIIIEHLSMFMPAGPRLASVKIGTLDGKYTISVDKTMPINLIKITRTNTVEHFAEIIVVDLH